MNGETAQSILNSVRFSSQPIK